MRTPGHRLSVPTLAPGAIGMPIRPPGSVGDAAQLAQDTQDTNKKIAVTAASAGIGALIGWGASKALRSKNVYPFALGGALLFGVPTGILEFKKDDTKPSTPSGT